MRLLQFPGLAEFPFGACSDASYFLGQVLSDQGLSDWTYRTGQNEHRRTHAWIEKEGLILDITADQFDEVDQRVVVSHDDGWHSQFEAIAGNESRASLQGSRVEVLRAEFISDYDLVAAYAIRIMS